VRELLRKVRIHGLKRSLRFASGEIRYLIAGRLLKGSYSQRGEDLLSDRLLGGKVAGYYVDVGANDPVRYNNTMRFYRRGWSGINIEPDPDSFVRLERTRPRDLNLNIGIGLEDRKMPFFRFFPQSYSTFSEPEAERNRRCGFALVETIDLPVRRLDEVLDEYRGDKPIDLISVDTEGFDLYVLRSNDWGRFRPTVVVIDRSLRVNPAQGPVLPIRTRN